MIPEEKYINRLKKNHKYRFITIVVVTSLALIILIVMIYGFTRLSMYDFYMTESHISEMLEAENNQQNLAEILHRAYLINQYNIEVMFCIIGLLIAFVVKVVVIAQQIDPKPRLIISMWDRIQDFENEVNQLKSHSQSDGQQEDPNRPADAVD